MTVTTTIGIADYAVFGGVLVVSIGIGIYYGCTGDKQSTAKEYLLANRKMNFLPVSVSLMASFVSAITILGMPSEVFTYGLIYITTTLMNLIIVPVGAHLFLPIFYRLELTSIYEYLELRFNKPARIIGTCFYVLYKCLYLSIAVYAPSLALSAVSGINVWISVITIGAVCTLYTTLGGMKAVIWTDVLQSCCMFIGVIAVIIQGCIDLGGISNVWRIADEGGRIYFLDWSLDPTVRHTEYSIVIGYTLGVIPTLGISQATAQRFLSCSSVREGQKAMYTSIPMLMMIAIFSCLAGVVMYATYADCDPLAAGYVSQGDQRTAFFIMDKFSHLPGLAGVFIAAVFSGALSTLSSGLNSLAAVTLEDFLKQFKYFANLSDYKTTLVLKATSALYGCLAIILVLIVSEMGLILQLALSIGNLVLAPVLGLFSLGLFFPWTNSKGAITGVLAGFTVAMIIMIGMMFYPPYWPQLPMSTEGCLAGNITVNSTEPFMISTTAATSLHGAEAGFAWFLNMSYLWYSPLELTVTLIVGITVSFLTGFTDPNSIDPRLISPVVYPLCKCCLPSNMRRHSVAEKEEFVTSDEMELSSTRSIGVDTSL